MPPLTALLGEIVSSPKTVTLAVESPRTKPAFVKKIVEGLLKLGDITYFDFDLQFSSFLQNIQEEIFRDWISRGLVVIQPGDDPMDVMTSFSSLPKTHSTGVFILDSINSLQTLLSTNNSSQTAKLANYKSSILLSVLQLVARSYSKSFLVFDLTKLRPRPQIDQTISWEKELVGGRMIRYKSDTIYFVSEMKDGSKDNLHWASKRVQLKEATEEKKAETYSVDL